MATSIRTVPTEFVHCRCFGHAWEEIPDDGGGRRVFSEIHGARKLFRCTRCSMRRYEAWSRLTGDLLVRHYVPPDGYRLARDMVNVRIARREYLRRQVKPTTTRKARRVA